MHDGHNPERARAALHSLDPGTDRAAWVRAAMASKAAGLTLDDFTAWSEPAANFKSAADCASVWRGIEADGGITAATLFSMARNAGWSDTTSASPAPDFSELLKKRETPAQAPQQPEQGKHPPFDVQAAWEAGEPATGAHPYIARKRGDPAGLKVYRGPDRIAGQALDGALMLPAFDMAGKLQTLQFIPSEGKKLNAYGHPVRGAFVVGRITAPGTGQTICIVEGIGQAWSCNQAAGLPAVVAFGAGRLKEVAQDFAARYPAARLVLVADAGKEQQCADIAKALRCAWVEMPPGSPSNFDANDLHQRDGAEALAGLLRNPKMQPHRFKLLNAANLEAMPPIEWRIKGVLPARGLAQIYGPSKAGKSFLSFDMACHIAEGREWFGYRVKPAPVVYVALEGEAGFKLRAEAWKRHNGRPLPDSLHMVMQPFRINEPQDVQDLAEVVPPGAVVVIDTQSRAAPDADENSGKDMGKILDGGKTLHDLIGGLVVLVAHTGKDPGAKDPRGHSSQTPNMEGSIEVSRTGDSRKWRAHKVKDGVDGAEHGFRLEVIELGTDDDGDPMTSCAITGEDLAPRQAHKKMTENQRQGIDAYRLACEAGEGVLDPADNFIGLHVEAWRPRFYAISTADGTEAKKKAFQRTRKDLAADGLATVENDVYRVIDPSTSILEGGFSLAARNRDTGQSRDITGTCPDH